MSTIEESVKQLERSERGQKTCKLLLDFLKSHAVHGLDQDNCEAVVTLASYYLLGTGSQACAVKDAMEGIINRNKWVLA